MKKELILVGGFLGAGKTSLLWEIAKKLNSDKKRVGLITNDQASELVDTIFLETNEDIVEEVSGSCFCCNFNGFIDAIDHVVERNGSEIIVAEPVGSCTDLSATILQPVKDKFADTLDLKPLTAVADPARLKAVLADHSSPADYIIYKQFEEADVILINKVDLLTDEELQDLVEKTTKEFPLTKLFTASVKEDKGLDEWLEYVRTTEKTGTKIVEVDYDVYAAGEAAFGWVNDKYVVTNEENLEQKAKDLLTKLDAAFKEKKLNVGHVKFLVQSKTSQFIGNITGGKENSLLRTLSNKKDGEDVTVIVNGRVETTPELLSEVIFESVKEVFGAEVKLDVHNALIPGRPNPTHRYSEVVEK